VSKANIERLFTCNPETAAEDDAFLMKIKAESELPEFKQAMITNGLALLHGTCPLLAKLKTLISLNITRKM